MALLDEAEYFLVCIFMTLPDEAGLSRCNFLGTSLRNWKHLQHKIIFIKTSCKQNKNGSVAASIKGVEETFQGVEETSRGVEIVAPYY